MSSPLGQSASWKRTLKNAGYVTAIIGLGLLATGCSKKPSSKTTTNYQVRVWRLDQSIDSFRDYIKDFQSTYKTTTVTYSQKSEDGYEFAALKSLAGQLGPDIWSVPNDWLGDYQDQVIPLPDNFYAKDGVKDTPKPVDQVRADYPAGIAEQLISVDGTKVYGLPTNVDTLQLYVNNELFNQALQDFRDSQGSNLRDETYQPVRQLLSKPPTTWSDLVEQTKYLTKRNGTTITRSAIAMGTADNVPDAQDVLQLLMLQNGTKITSDDHKSPLFHVTQSTPAGSQVRPGEKALEFMASFSDPNKATYSWNPSMPQALDAFGQGKVAMVIAYSDFGKQLKVKYPKLDYEAVAVPQISAAQTPANLVKFSVETVTKTANNSSAAFAFLKTYIGKNDARNLAREQKLNSPYKETLTDQAKDTFQASQILTGTAVYKRSHTQFDSVFRQMIVDVSQNGISSADAVKSGGDKIDALLNPTDSAQ